MPRTIEDLATLIARRDEISYEEALAAVRDVAAEMQEAFKAGDLDLAETFLREDLGLEPDYLDIFIF